MTGAALRATLIATALALLAGACSRETKDAAPVAPAAAADITAPAEVHLGRAVPGAKIEGEVEVRAVRATRLVAVKTSCECTSTDAAVPRSLAADERYSIPIAIDLAKLARGGLPPETEGGPGHLRRDIVLQTPTGETTVGLLVDISDAVRLEPPSAWLGTVALGSEAAGSLRVVPGSGASTVHVSAAESSEPALKVDVVPDPPGDRLLLSWKPAAIGTQEAVVTLRLDAPQDPVVKVPVTIDAVLPVRVRPDRIENLGASISQPVVVRIELDRIDGRDLEVLSAASDNHRVVVKLLPGEGRSRAVQVVIPVLALPAEEVGTVTLRTSVPGAESLTVPFRVRAAAAG